MKTNYIYSLEDLANPGVVRYIGRTNNPARRLFQHKSLRGNRCHKIHWISEVLKSGGDIKMEILEEYPAENEADMKSAEEFYISYLKFLGSPLTNSTHLSCGVVQHSPEIRAKMSEIQKLRKPEVNAKISATLAGRKMDPERYAKLLARVQSPEWKEKMSKVHKGKKLTDEQKEHLSKIRTGMKIPGVGAKISASLKGKPKSPEHIEKSAAAHRGKKLGPQTPEQIARRVEARLATMARKKQEAALAVSHLT